MNGSFFSPQDSPLLLVRPVFYNSTNKRALSSTTRKYEQTTDTLQMVAEWIRQSEKHCEKDILVLCGAGVSVAAGIPDFRTPGTGLYDNLQTYNLPYPEAVFDLEYFRQSPQAFLSLARDLWPGLKAEHSPTLTHSFLALLAEKKVLLRCYTQNIDGLEFLAGVPASRLVECHGHFRTASCTKCGAPADIDKVKATVLAVEGAGASGNTNNNSPARIEPQICDYCGVGYIKPDIVFFGEMLPDKVPALLGDDLAQADLLLILGTSLQVAPVAMIPDSVHPECRRVLLNRELVGNLNLHGRDEEGQPRDLFHSGDCDESVLAICRHLGWEKELLERNEMARINAGA
jgi:NAD-dependent SIR2 family protein deacetylase